VKKLAALFAAPTGMKSTTVSLEDVAKRAGVSTATVSRVLNEIGVVRNSTRAKVLRAAEELRYTPNIHARALAGGTSRTLGLVVSNIENPFFLDIYRRLEELAHRANYEVLIANTDYNAERLKSAVRLMLGRRPAGLALVVSEIDTALFDELSERRVNTVVYDVGAPRRYLFSIKTNYRVGMQRVAEYLVSLGHRRFAFVGHHTSLGPLSERRRTFIEIMKQYEAVEFTTAASADGFHGGRQAVRNLLASGFRPTAIICVNDFMAVGVLRELRDAGLAVPGDVSVTGFDNISLSEMAYPALTTVHIPREQIGKHLFDALTRSPEKAAAPREVIIEPELVLRDSTGPAAA
jgi:DNA-binding LacI/PurR family transcriptional regulator